MGVYNAEIFTNIGLCCFYAQQFDLALNCIEKAVALAEGESQADLWYNVGHIALVNLLIFSVRKSRSCRLYVYVYVRYRELEMLA